MKDERGRIDPVSCTTHQWTVLCDCLELKVVRLASKQLN